MPKIDLADLFNNPIPPGGTQRTRIIKNGRQFGPWFTLHCECVRESDKAILIYDDDLGPIWIPKSHVSEDSEVYKAGDKGKLIITEWIAGQKGMLDGITTERKPVAKPEQPGLELVESYKIYRTFVRKYHPDINPQPWAQEAMQDLTSLWHSVLKETKKK